MNKLGPVISAHYREGSFLNIAKYVFKFPKSPGPGHFVLCFFCAFVCGDCYRAGEGPKLLVLLLVFLLALILLLLFVCPGT